jgi:predicted nucleotidyltransferase component of viral defense system
MAKEEILSPEQVEFLKLAATYPFLAREYYLTGGTPLAAFYLHHRYSEDLDFFTEKAEVNLLSVQKLLKTAQRRLKPKKLSYQNYQGLHMFFLKYPSGRELKVDFNYYPFPRIEKGIRTFGLVVDSLRDIAVNKIQTIATRTAARDFVDVYFIASEAGYSIRDLLRSARIKFDWHIEPIQIGKQFLKVKKLADYPRMIRHLDRDKMIAFFLKEANGLKRDIFKR